MGSIVAELLGTSTIRVAFISAVPSVGQSGVLPSLHRGQGPSSWWQPSAGSGSGRQDMLDPEAAISVVPQPVTSSRDGDTGVLLAAAHPLDSLCQHAHLIAAAGKSQQLTFFFPIYFAASSCLAAAPDSSPVAE